MTSTSTGAIVATFYFAGVWGLMAQEHRLVGALVLLAVGIAVATLRAPRSAARSSSAPVDDAPVTSPTPSVRQTIESHSAEQEKPEHRRARFLGALGHELRNPLNSVTGFSDILLSGADGPLNTEQEQSVRTIRESAERLLRLVSTVVDRARLDAGILRLQQQWLAPAELVAEVGRFVRSRAEGCSLIGDVVHGLPRVFVDRDRTIQALVGLSVLVLQSSQADVSLRVAPPRRDQAGKGFVQFDLMGGLHSTTSDTLSIVELLERPRSRADALGVEVSVARSLIEAQGGRIWSEAGTAGSLRVCMTLPTFATDSASPAPR